MYISVRHAANMFPEADVIRVAPDGANVTLLAYTPGSLQQDFIAEVDARSMGNLTTNGDLDNGDYLAVDVRIQKGRGAEVPIYYQRTIDVPVIAAAAASATPKMRTVIAAKNANNAGSAVFSATLPADYATFRWISMTVVDSNGIGSFTMSTALFKAASVGGRVTINSGRQFDWRSTPRTIALLSTGANFLELTLHD